MLLQSHSSVIAILPALPAAWPEGYYRGLCARGDVEVDATWSNGKAISAVLHPALAGEYKLRPPHGQRIAKIQVAGRAISAIEVNGFWQVHLEPRKEYTIAFQ